jgi:hypothetical protein
MTWSLSKVLEGLHNDIHQKLETVRKSFNHPGTKGDGSEQVWLDLLNEYLPERYQAAKAHVVDSKGNFSEQIDVVVFDRQYSPFIFSYSGQIIIPAESVYAVFESKQAINADEVAYAQKKIASVRKLHRTSLPIPHAGGTYPPKPLIHIYGGILTFESDWKPAFGQPMSDAVSKDKGDGRIDLGCIAAHGYFNITPSGAYETHPNHKAATGFLFKLISLLQFSGTVPMIDIQAYANWLNVE